MLIEEAIKLLRSGKKIRSKTWEKDNYIYLKGVNILWKRKIDGIYTDSIWSFIKYDWEEYVEPIKYLNLKECLISLAEGKKIKKDSSDNYIYLNDDGEIVNRKGYKIFLCLNKDDKYFVIED